MLHDMGQLEAFNKIDWEKSGYKYTMTLNEPNVGKRGVADMLVSDAACYIRSTTVGRLWSLQMLPAR